MLSNSLNKTNRARRVKRMFTTVMLCLLTLGGCNPWIGDPVVEVIGEVTLDRKVLTGAKVVFVPMRFRNDEGLINPLAFGITDGTGRFELESGDQKGVLLGRYRVLIFRTGASEDGPPDGETIVGASDQSNGAKQDIAAKRTGSGLAELLNEPETLQRKGETIPTKYNLDSELEYVVDMPVGIVYPKFELTSN